MEVKPFVGHINRLFVLACFIIGLVSCSSSRITIDVLELPVSEFSEPIERIAVINRVGVQYSNTKQYVNGRVVAQYNGITDIMVNESITQLVADLNVNNFVMATDTSLKYIPKNARFDRPGSKKLLLSKSRVQRVCQDLGVNALVTVDGYDAEVDTDSDVQYSTPVDRNYGTVRVPYFTGDQSVLMTMLYRTYICKQEGGVIEDETVLATQVSIASSGSTPYDVNVNLADANNILIQASRNLGADYAGQITPKWKTQSRTIFITGSDQLKDAYKLAKTGNWPSATDIWYLVASSNNEKIAKRASFNLILASEISGDYALAEEWANRCIDKYQMAEAEKYLILLIERKKEIEKLQKLFPLMD